jgi:cbb3-type cytochrome oxidase subunit 3
MDFLDWRSLVTLVTMVLFIVLVIRAWSPRQRSAHDAAAQLPFVDSEPAAPDAADDDATTNSGGRRG